MEEIIIMRVCEPGKCNCNGVIYSKEEYDKAINDTRLTELMKNKLLISEFGHPKNADIVRQLTFDFKNSAGIITKITDTSISLLPKDESISNIIKNNINNIKAEMRYIGKLNDNNDGTKTVTNLKIITFDLIQEGVN